MSNAHNDSSQGDKNMTTTTTIEMNDATYRIDLDGDAVSVTRETNGVNEHVAHGRWDDDSYTLQDMEASESLCDAVELAILDIV